MTNEAENSRERKTQYDKGIEHALVLLTLSVDFYPQRLSAATLAALGTSDSTTKAIYVQLQRFRERIAAEVRSGKEKEAAA